MLTSIIDILTWRGWRSAGSAVDAPWNFLPQQRSAGRPPEPLDSLSLDPI